VVAVSFLYAVYCFARLSWVLGILFLLFALVYGLVLYTWRHRIPFAVILVQTVMDTMVSYPSTLLVSFVSIVFAVGFSVLFTFGAIYACNVWSGGALAAVLVYYVFGFYWTSQVRAGGAAGHAALDRDLSAPLRRPAEGARPRWSRT